MFIKLNQTIFLFSLITGSVIAISSNSWFTAWLGLEINLLSIIPLILNKLNPNLTDSAIKYFLSQALASLILIFSVTLNFHTSSLVNLLSSENIILIALVIKAGIPPFHFWFPQVIKTIGWIQCLTLFTWQKIAPLILLRILNINKILFTACLGVIVGAIGGLNQTIIKPLIAYSAIRHSRWILVACASSSFIWLTYFIVYSTLSTCVITFLKKCNTNSLTEFSHWDGEKTNKNIFIFNIMSIAGLPPFLGFIAKINILIFIVSISLIYASIIFILASLISLYFYFRLSYNISINKTKNKKINLILNKSTFRTILTLGTALNIFIPMLSPVI